MNELESARKTRRRREHEAWLNGPPNVELDLWVRGTEVWQIHTPADSLPVLLPEGKANWTRARILLDTLWLATSREEAGDEENNQTLLTIHLDGQGWINMRSNDELETESTYRHALWLLRQWWRVTKWWLALVWRVWRHPQKRD